MAETKAAKKRADGGKFWVVHQHQDADVVQDDKRPDTKVEKGQRAKIVHGPFPTHEAAKARADLIVSKTTRARLERAG